MKRKEKTSSRKSRGRSSITIIVKRRGHSEKYEERKVYASCFFACKNTHMHDKDCEKVANRVAKSITKFVKEEGKKSRVTSTEIFEKIARELRKYNKDAAFLYATHRDIS